MLLLVTTSLPKLRAAETPHLGRLFTPRMLSNITGTVACEMPWAADNDGFNGFKEEPYLKMLAKIQHKPGCLFVSAPDVLCDAEQTLSLFSTWKTVIRSHGLPVALVGQDGLEKHPVPWDDIDALFIGGSTEWKLGAEAASIVQEAKTRHKWVHMGRVNSHKRIKYAHSIGCDSVDGSSYGRFTRAYVPDALALLAELGG